MSGVRAKASLSLFALVAFALLSAMRDVEAKVLFDEQQSDVNPIYLTWFGSVVTGVLFYVIACVRLRRFYILEDIRNADGPVHRHLILLNVGTLVAFLTTFLAIDHLNAYTNSIIDYGASPVVTAALAVTIRGERIPPSALGGMLLSVIGIVFLAPALIGDSQSSRTEIHGMILAATSCVAFGLNQVWNKEVVNAGILRERVIVARLLLIVGALGFWCIFIPPPDVHLWRLIVWSALGIALPLYLLIYALERLEVKNVSFALFLIPVFAFLGTLLTGGLESDALWLHIVAGSIVTAGVIWSERASQAV